MRIIRKTWYQFLQYQDYMLGVWSCQAMQLRGFSSRPVHPKHLFDEKRAVMLHELFSSGVMFLDLGSGVGSDCLAACDAGAALAVGLEGNLESIRTAIMRSREKGSSAHFMHNRNGILKELKRVKKEDGVGVISIPNADTSWKKKLRAAGLDSMDDPDHKIEYTKKSLAEELGAADLTIESKLMPIIPSFPWNGLIAMSAAVSPKIYRRLQSWKRA